MEAPPHLLERPPGAQIAIAVGGAALLGIICGLLLGWTEVGYLALSILAILGGIAAGYDHPTADEGAVRGLCGGMVFGACILATNAVTGADPKADLPDPPAVLVVVTTVFGIIFGAIGGALRRRHDSRITDSARPGRAA